MSIASIKKKRMNFAAKIALGFLVIILLGTLLLMLPISSKGRTATSFLDASFTATSAVCVTGLVRVDTALHWSMFGQTVILLLIQTGGLGFMSLALALMLLFHRTVTAHERKMVLLSYNVDRFDSARIMIRRVFMGTFVAEGIGAVLLCFRFVPMLGARGVFKSIFTSVSAFCNAGFDLMGDVSGEGTSMMYFADDPLVTLTLAFLIILGGVGFLVFHDVANLVRHRRRPSVYTKLVLMMTVIAIGVGMISFAAVEWNNPLTIGGMTVGQKLLASFFYSVTLRTAGFSTINNGGILPVTRTVAEILMFVGAASGSTAGGVKLVTVFVLFFFVANVVLGRHHAVIFHRRISESAFVRAVSVIVVQLVAVLLGAALAAAWSPTLSEGAVFYEAVSAISTVGLSLGITAELSAASSVVMMILMYFGRVGILTVSCAILRRQDHAVSTLEYPEAKMLIG